MLIPIADYLCRRNADESYLTSKLYRDDRERLRGWVIRSLVKPGIWGSGLDTFLGYLRRTMRERPIDAFPVEAIETEMAKSGKSLRFDSEDIEDLAETPYRNKRVFPLLTLLYPGVDVRNEFHEDHIFPKSMFTASRLRKAGVPDDSIDDFLARYDRLPNLQLLEGSVNTAKLTTLPLDWANERYPDADARSGYLASHDMHDLPGEVTGFVEFYDARKGRMAARLRELLGATGDR